MTADRPVEEQRTPPPISPGMFPARPSVQALRDVIAAAYQERDWNAFESALFELGARDTAEAHEALRDLLADRTMHFRPDAALASRFAEWLKSADVTGLPEAARWRVEEQFSVGEASSVGVQGWFDLVALHGGSDDLAWLEERDESSQARDAVQRALLLARHDKADEILIKMLRSRELDARALNRVGDEDPRKAVEFLELALPELASMKPSHDWGPSIIARYAALIRRTDPSERSWLAAETTARQAFGADGVMLVLHERVRSGHENEALLQRVRRITMDVLRSIAVRARTTPLESVGRVHIGGLLNRILATLDATPALQTRAMSDAVRVTGLAFDPAESAYHRCARAAAKISAATE